MPKIRYNTNMYLGVDIGGTKTLAATLNDHGVIQQETRIPTNPDYPTFVKELADVIKAFDTKEFIAAGVGMPVTDFDRKRGIGIAFGNLPWHMAPVKHDIQKIAGAPVVNRERCQVSRTQRSNVAKNTSQGAVHHR